MINPLTRMPTVAPLAMLVDHIGGLITTTAGNLANGR
jgi:hypothetical protein